MTISDARRQFIADIARHEWIDRLSDEERENDALYEAMAEKMSDATDAFLGGDLDPEELHLFATLCTRDGGLERLKQVITHSACDAGTALMVYWMTRPEWFVQYATAAEAGWDKESFVLIQTIEQRYLAGSYRSRTDCLRSQASRTGRPVP